MDNAEKMKRLISAREWPKVKKETVEMVNRVLTGRRAAAATLTIRQRYDAYAGEWVKCAPEDGEGIKAIKRVLECEWGLCPGVDCWVFSREDEKDRKLHIVFDGDIEKIEFSFDMFNWSNGDTEPQEPEEHWHDENKTCAYCGKEIDPVKDGFVMCRDNFLQAKYFDELDGSDNVFCSQDCACAALSIERVFQTEDGGMM